MEEFIKASGLIITNMVKAIKSLLMAQPIKVIMSEENLKVVVDFNGKMANYIKENG